MAKEVNVKFSEKDVINILKNKLLVENPEKMAELITSHLAKSEVGIEQFVKAMWGVYPGTSYKVGQHVYVDFKHLPSWRNIDKEKTLALKTSKDDYVLCKIYIIDIYSICPLYIKFHYVSKDGKEGVDGYHIPDKDVVSIEEDLEQFLEESEDLPF